MAERDRQDQRQVIANLWHICAQIDRPQFFGDDDDAKWRPLHLQDESATMTVGYLGSRYRVDTDLFLLGINPGGGSDAHVTRNRHDEHIYPRLMSFKGAPAADALAAFEQLQRVYPSAIRSWPLWTIIEPILDAVRRSLDTVTLMNVVPYRTRNDKPPPTRSRNLGWEIVATTLQHLRPKALVVLGREAGKVVNKFHNDDDRPVYCVPRMRGDRGVKPTARDEINRLRDEAKHW